MAVGVKGQQRDIGMDCSFKHRSHCFLFFWMDTISLSDIFIDKYLLRLSNTVLTQIIFRAKLFCSIQCQPQTQTALYSEERHKALLICEDDHRQPDPIPSCQTPLQHSLKYKAIQGHPY